jgi:hypothetical protein
LDGYGLPAFFEAGDATYAPHSAPCLANASKQWFSRGGENLVVAGRVGTRKGWFRIVVG